MAQRVMITAAASGIGRAMAKAFHDTGAKVHICDVNDEALQIFRKDFPDIAATKVNVRSESEIDAWFDDALEDLGGLDVMINNAGIKGPTAPVDDIDLAEWKECIEICLDAQFLCARRAAPVMKAQKSGLILNMSSNAGQYGFGNRTPYAAAKWAVIGLTKSLAIELGPYNVRCNAICPGGVAGDRINRVIQGEASLRNMPFDRVARELVAGQSLERFVEAHEIAALAVFLASPAAFMINGQDVAMDGHIEAFHIK
ncbi:SDR family oxidoreductase [Aestuariivirga litoralis]|uniref:SDR family oxidoreductase n=1 Tax=Aestuariivirga litoralis TaxID=2650924 RepID=UPI001FEE8626|nr:SDR family oxidoreductase [Aestuariivirga litoralis]